ncbi:MAG: UMP kinase [Spirochaetota bacterium]|nr:UMP kinase [Spirochaetota bacterium]
MEDESDTAKIIYKRILLKLSGEALAGRNKIGIDTNTIREIANSIADVYRLGIEIAIVNGGGNIFRGEIGKELGLDRCTGDSMGMLATTINSLAIGDAIEKLGIPVSVMSSIEMHTITESYNRKKAIELLQKGQIVLLSCGTGNPLFTTDTTAALRATELNAEIVLKATRVDGVYNDDPEINPDAKRIESISYLDVIQKNLRVMDLTAISLCMENNMPIYVFDLFDENSIKRIVQGEKIGTIIS